MCQDEAGFYVQIACAKVVKQKWFKPQKFKKFYIDNLSLITLKFIMEDRNLPKQQTIIEQKSKAGTVMNKYIKGRYLGKGGFAKCYEITHTATGKKFAAKIIEKATLTRSKAKEKLATEIQIHKSVKSQFVVKYQKYFQDSVNVYIILELCTNQTMNQLIKRRKRISQIQTRYYLRQIALAIKDFQNQMIIHRDLKLGNLLLTQNLQIRISDFGLAAKLNHPGERRKTMCGTPNYIAPQILENHSNSGHSYEVDIWSLGVIAYACLVGRPPFETNDVKTTYSKIKMCNYSFPDHITLSTVSQHFISKMLQKDPRHRSTIQQILSDQFFNLPIPQALPTTLLACPPNKIFLDKYQVSTQPQLKHRESSQSQLTQKTERYLEKGQSVKTLIRTNSIEQLTKTNYCNRAASTAALTRRRLVSSKHEQPKATPPLTQVQAPPYVWIVFHEQNPKFGISYLLNSNAIGMRYNDSTSLVANNGFTKMKYIDFFGRSDEEKTHEMFDVNAIPEHLSKKFKIITYYQKQLKNKKENYQNGLNNDQLILREKYRFKETSQTAMNVWVTKHCKTTKANFFWFNNKDYQIIFQDFTELLFSKENLTYVNKLGQRIYFTRNNIESQIQEIKKRVKYAETIVKNLKESSKNNKQNKQNKPEQVQLQTMIRSSSVIKMQKPQQPLLMRGSASTSRLPANPRILKY